MAEEKNNNSNLAAKSAQAANTVRGAVKTGKAIAGAGQRRRCRAGLTAR